MGEREPYEEGGDPVCWLSRVCEECGAFVEGVGATPCWRCGAVAEAEARSADGGGSAAGRAGGDPFP